MKKLQLRTHPYTFGRVSAMKSYLLRREDYEALMKMGFYETLNFIQEKVCTTEIRELNINKIDEKNIEKIMDRHLEKVFNKLKRISKKELRTIIGQYLKRYDVRDIKSILRAKYTHVPEEQIQDLLSFTGELTRKQLEACIKKENVEDIIKMAKKLGIQGASFQEKLSQIEDKLDIGYYKELLAFAERIPNDKFLKKCIEGELETRSLINMLRSLQIEGEHKDNIQQELQELTTPSFKKKLAKASKTSIEKTPEVFKNTPYYNILKEGLAEYEKTKSLGTVDIKLRGWLLKQVSSLFKKKPASIEYLLGYLFAKETEIRNLKVIVKGKQTGLENSFIESRVVMPSV